MCNVIHRSTKTVVKWQRLKPKWSTWSWLGPCGRTASLSSWWRWVKKKRQKPRVYLCWDVSFKEKIILPQSRKKETVRSLCSLNSFHHSEEKRKNAAVSWTEVAVFNLQGVKSVLWTWCSLEEKVKGTEQQVDEMWKNEILTSTTSLKIRVMKRKRSNGSVDVVSGSNFADTFHF